MGDMNTKFAEQAGKMTFIQWQLGAVITLITVASRDFKAFSGRKINPD